MTGRSRLAASALGSLMLLGTPATSGAQSPLLQGDRVAAVASGAIHGIVRDEAGAPISGVLVSALGPTTTVAVSDREGRFELRTLSPGPYLVRAHQTGYIAPRAQLIEVRSSVPTVSSIALRRVNAPAVVEAGFSAVAEAAPASVPAQTAEPATAPAATVNDDDHSEFAWRLRHARRGVLRERTLPDTLVDVDDSNTFALARAMESPAHLAASFFADTPFSGQVNLLTTGTFDTPQQLFSPTNFAKGIAYLRLGAPVGGHADWTVRAALNQADISSWILAGSYTTRGPARHAYDIGMSYSTQRYDGGNALALRDVADGSRNAGAVYGFDTFTITPALVLTYGGRYARYDYLDNRTLLSPRAEITVTPASHLRLSAQLSRRAQAPGAEEFLPPGDTGIWLPPQRTFSSLKPNGQFEAEQTTRVGVSLERDIAGSTIGVSAFRQEVEGQLVALFGVSVPDQPDATIGHYVVGNAGNVSAAGCTASFRTSIADRVSGSVAYSMTSASLTPQDQVRYLLLLSPSALRSEGERIHDVSTAIETHVPETATRVLVLYRVSNGFARSSPGSAVSDRSGLDSRFDIQVRQSLPFLNFTSAKWEMLVAVRNFFRETAPDHSVYDELLVVRPPKRIVGGVTMRF